MDVDSAGKGWRSQVQYMEFKWRDALTRRGGMFAKKYLGIHNTQRHVRAISAAASQPQMLAGRWSSSFVAAIRLHPNFSHSRATPTRAQTRADLAQSRCKPDIISTAPSSPTRLTQSPH